MTKNLSCDIDFNIVDKICECEPYKVVFKDSAFKYDNDKINLEEKFKKSIAKYFVYIEK